MRIYVSNLAPEVTAENLREEFQVYGSVVSVILAKNHYVNSSRGFGWVEMLRVSEGQTAVKCLNGKLLKERAIVVRVTADWSEAGRIRPGGK